MPKEAKAPVKHCKFCGELMNRKRYNGRLEDLTVFSKRKYCNQVCMAKGMIQEDVTLAGLRFRAAKFRKTQCETCGTVNDLQIHHLDSNPANNAQENLMTLCATCHAKWHYEHGKSNKKTPKMCEFCDKPARKKGLCNTHASRMRRHGDPHMVHGGKKSQV